eukprot:TRINITY_DN3760_c0_g1_i1.p1 TRINITY_DN3760_c0_g1~~TRINITY_DN3760_c0_g1_i1.p1  ORF type:complete len:210 (+),score=40.72 TRINITY_DN3760_c0_g1_i1:262-891(+)
MNGVTDTDAKVELTILSSSDEEVLSNIELTSDKEGNYKVDDSSSWENAEPGFYSLAFKVTPSKEEEAFTEEEIFRSSKIIGKITKTTIEVYSYTSEDDSPACGATYPDPLPKTVKVDQKYLRVKVKFESDIAPTQVFIQFEKGDKSCVYVAKLDEDQYYTFQTELESSDFYENIFGSGKYAISLIVGDALLNDFAFVASRKFSTFWPLV